MEMNTRQRAFTLIEIVVGAAIGLMVALAAASLFVLISNMGVATTQSYLIARNLDDGIRQLRADLSGAPLATIRPYPLKKSSGDPPGLTLASARDAEGRLVLDEQGSPRWQRWVLYSLEVKPGERTGSLVRWEKEMDEGTLLPRLSPLGPTPVPAGKGRVVLREIVAPNAELPGVGSDGKLQAGPSGGFQVSFVRLRDGGDYELATLNPAQVTQGETPGQLAGNTRLVEVQLQLYEPSRTGKASYVSVSFRVATRY